MPAGAPLLTKGWTRAWLLQDWNANGPALRIKLGLVGYRAAQAPQRLATKPVRRLYRLLSGVLLGIDLPWQVAAGPGLRIDHGYGLVIHPDVTLGAGCMLRHGVTVGQARRGGPVPVIGDHVDFGTGAVVLGPVDIGSDAVIGANAVVIKSVPAGAVAVGNPARIL